MPQEMKKLRYVVIVLLSFLIVASFFLRNAVSDYSQNQEQLSEYHIAERDDAVSNHRSKNNRFDKVRLRKSVSQIRRIIADENPQESIKDYIAAFRRWDADDGHEALLEINRNSSWKLLHCYAQAFYQNSDEHYQEHHWEFLKKLFEQHISHCKANPILAKGCTPFSNITSFTALIQQMAKNNPAAAKALLEESREAGLLYYMPPSP